MCCEVKSGRWGLINERRAKTEKGVEGLTLFSFLTYPLLISVKTVENS